MSEYGLLIDYEWCTGCQTCEVACQIEHKLPPTQWGMKIVEIGPWEYAPEAWQYVYMPFPTDQCDLCAERTGEGKLPTCVHHCQARCLEYGKLDNLYKKLTVKKKAAVFHL